MNIENFLQQQAADTIAALYGPADPAAVQIQKTRKEFEGDYTLVVFPLLKLSRKKTRRNRHGDRRSAGEKRSRNQRL